MVIYSQVHAAVIYHGLIEPTPQQPGFGWSLGTCLWHVKAAYRRSKSISILGSNSHSDVQILFLSLLAILILNLLVFQN